MQLIGIKSAMADMFQDFLALLNIIDFKAPVINDQARTMGRSNSDFCMLQ